MISDVKSFDKFRSYMLSQDVIPVLGRVSQVVGLIAESDGPEARIGDLCYIEPGAGSSRIEAEVVGFKGEKVLLMPLGSMVGVRSGSLVHNTRKCFQVAVGQKLLGRILNGLGDPIDDAGPLKVETFYPVDALPPSAMTRPMIREPFVTSIRAIDALLSIGQGQRIGIFSGSGVGKSTLLGMIARNGQADINVIALVGERGREVREFIENDLGPEGMKKSVVIVATADQPALIRLKAALSATTIAEYFRDQGNNVLLMMDSVTRFAMAQREVGLAVGEPPTTKGYTPSVFAMLPRFMERAGCSPKGSITAIYTILVEGGDNDEPIADTARSILDGHIVLSRKLTNKGHYPPIDAMESLSRVMQLVVSPDHNARANRLRELIAAYREIEDLISIGAYKKGAKPLADCAVARWEPINQFLRQEKESASEFKDTLKRLWELTGE